MMEVVVEEAKQEQETNDLASLNNTLKTVASRRYATNNLFIALLAVVNIYLQSFSSYVLVLLKYLAFLPRSMRSTLMVYARDSNYNIGENSAMDH